MRKSASRRSHFFGLPSECKTCLTRRLRNEWEAAARTGWKTGGVLTKKPAGLAPSRPSRQKGAERREAAGPKATAASAVKTPFAGFQTRSRPFRRDARSMPALFPLVHVIKHRLDPNHRPNLQRPPLATSTRRHRPHKKPPKLFIKPPDPLPPAPSAPRPACGWEPHRACGPAPLSPRPCRPTRPR